MTQEELQERISKAIVNDGLSEFASDVIMRLINQHVAEVIGEDIDSTEHYRAHKNDEGINIKLWKIDAVNAEHAEQRKRAGL